MVNPISPIPPILIRTNHTVTSAKVIIFYTRLANIFLTKAVLHLFGEMMVSNEDCGACVSQLDQGVDIITSRYVCSHKQIRTETAIVMG